MTETPKKCKCLSCYLYTKYGCAMSKQAWIDCIDGKENRYLPIKKRNSAK